MPTKKICAFGGEREIHAHVMRVRFQKWNVDCFFISLVELALIGSQVPYFI